MDILEPPLCKPLDLKEDFTPLKTCREYVEQDCAEAFPVFRPHSRALVRSGIEVGQTIPNFFFASQRCSPTCLNRAAAACR